MITEKVWHRVKDTAQRNAANRLHLSPEDSEKAVNRIIHSVDGPFPQSAVEFYGRELLRLTEEAQIVPDGGPLCIRPRNGAG
jgi:hypothetical protein